ncbi:MAG: sigma-70 family RNA polymerase sigma factor [Deltaproteobacteria bacterium]|nr:sigma-70 family RNA polymerase sigma factor [Deltaproteobacteria bacterium]
MAARATDRTGLESAAPDAKVMRPECFLGNDEALLERVRRGEPGAALALYDRHAPHLRRVLARIMGVDAELPDLLHESFANALAGIDQLRDAGRLRAWLSCIAVYTARGCIRRRGRRRWLELREPERVEQAAAPESRPEDAEALRRTYAVLDRMAADERIPFTLRFLEDMTLPEAAEACRVSLATIKRRLARAERTFVTAAREDPVLRQWVNDSPRWRER